MEERNYKVYIHKNKINNKVYIGITSIKPEERWRNGHGYIKQMLFYNAIKKYGWDNFKHEILFENLTKEEAEQKEIELIAQYNSTNICFGYNIQNGGNSVGKFTDETKKKMSESHKGLVFSQEHINNLRKARKGRESGFKGKKHTYETKRKMSEQRRGCNHPFYGKRGKDSPNYGKHHSEETKRKISEGNKGKIISQKQREILRQKNSGYNNPRSKHICQIDKYTGDLIAIFASAGEASRQLHLDKNAIRKCCIGYKYKTVGGFKWCYEDDFKRKGDD